VYSTPVELQYKAEIIHLYPTNVGFQLNLESMLAEADLQKVSESFWVNFWKYLWGAQISTQDVPLDVSFSEALLRSYLDQEIGSRYDSPPSPARPVPGSLDFELGDPGTTIDIDEAVFDIGSALQSPEQRTVFLPLQQSAAARPSLQNLQILLQQTIDLAGYDGLAGVYLLDLQTAQELHFLYQNGENISPEPDVAFTAGSIIKIPIMVSAFRRLGSDMDAEAARLLENMIIQSGNDPADWIMEQYIDEARGPLEVTADAQALGLENTFIAGHFRLGSELMARFETPANSRPDVNTDPDIYNQTTLSDMGMLLSDIYLCAETGGSTLLAVFPTEITQDECRQMIDLLAQNLLPSLITAGLPEGTRIAHKHGWTPDFTGVINTIGDAAIVFSPSGDYVLVIFFYHPVQLVWDPISALIADLSEAIYNYYNLPSR
jgi:beta-lactamase class A